MIPRDFAQSHEEVVKLCESSAANHDNYHKSDYNESAVAFVPQAKITLNESRNDGEREFYENNCNMLGKNIDEIVYQLYDLTPDEMGLIENS